MRLVPFRMDGTAFPSPGPKPRPRTAAYAVFVGASDAQAALTSTTGRRRLHCRATGMPDVRREHHRRANHTRSDAALTGCRENVFPPHGRSWSTNHRPPSIHGVSERAARRISATYVISVIELPLFSCHGCSDASLLPALGRTFYPPQRVHHSTGPTIAAGEVCRTGHNLRRPRRRLVPVGQGSALLAPGISRLSYAFNHAGSRAIACRSRRRGAATPAPYSAACAVFSAGPVPTPHGAARRPPRPRRRQGPAPW